MPPASKPDKPSLRTFATPDEAGKVLQIVAKSGDRAALIAIFGADSKEILSSGDDVQDRNGLNTFLAAYEEMHRWRSVADGAQTLLVGADNYPFPHPTEEKPERTMGLRRGRWERRDP